MNFQNLKNFFFAFFFHLILVLNIVKLMYKLIIFIFKLKKILCNLDYHEEFIQINLELLELLQLVYLKFICLFL